MPLALSASAGPERLFWWYGFRKRLSASFITYFPVLSSFISWLAYLTQTAPFGVSTGILFVGHLHGRLVLSVSILTVLALVAKRLGVWLRTSVCLEENVRSFDVKRTDVFSPSNRGTKKRGTSLVGVPPASYGWMVRLFQEIICIEQTKTVDGFFHFNGSLRHSGCIVLRKPFAYLVLPIA